MILFWYIHSKLDRNRSVTEQGKYTDRNRSVTKNARYTDLYL